MTLTERLDRLAFGPFHKRMLMMGGLGYLFDALDVGIIAFMLPALKVEWSLTIPQMGLLAAGSSIGGILGAILAGLAGDRFGRRRVMMWSLAIYCIATLGCALAQDWQQFLVLRIVAGIGTSAESAIIAPFLAEFAAPSYRGRYIGTLTAFFSGGFLAAALIGYTIVPLSPEAWRYALVITSLPIVMLLWWRRRLPESPRWLEAVGRHEEAERVVVEVERVSRPLDRSPQLLPGIALAEAPIPGPVGKLSIRLVGMTMLMWFAIGFAYYAFFTWTPTLLVEEGMAISRSFGFAIAIYGAQLPGYLIAAAVSDRIGRRALVTACLCASIAASIAMALAGSETAFVASAVVMSVFMNGTYAGLYAYTAELFPTHVRATVQGAAGAISRIGSAASPVVVGFLYPVAGIAGVFGTTGAVLVAAAAAVLFFGPDTRGRSLEQLAYRRENIESRT